MHRGVVVYPRVCEVGELLARHGGKNVGRKLSRDEDGDELRYTEDAARRHR